MVLVVRSVLCDLQDMNINKVGSFMFLIIMNLEKLHECDILLIIWSIGDYCSISLYMKGFLK